MIFWILLAVSILIGVPLLFFLMLFIYLYFVTLNVKVKSKKALKQIDAKSPYRKAPPPRRPHNKLYAKIKDKQREEVLEEEKNYTLGLRKYNEQGIEFETVGEEVEIVGLIELKKGPETRWRWFIRNQKAKFILARIQAQQSPDKGFWTNLIKAQAMSQGKGQGRGR